MEEYKGENTIKYIYDYADEKGLEKMLLGKELITYYTEERKEHDEYTARYNAVQKVMEKYQ